MNIIIISESESTVISNASIIPRIGDNVDVFHHPMPTVNRVILYPKIESYADLNLGIKISAIVVVD